MAPVLDRDLELFKVHLEVSMVKTTKQTIQDDVFQLQLSWKVLRGSRLPLAVKEVAVLMANHEAQYQRQMQLPGSRMTILAM